MSLLTDVFIDVEKLGWGNLKYTQRDVNNQILREFTGYFARKLSSRSALGVFQQADFEYDERQVAARDEAQESKFRPD